MKSSARGPMTNLPHVRVFVVIVVIVVGSLLSGESFPPLAHASSSPDHPPPSSSFPSRSGIVSTSSSSSILVAGSSNADTFLPVSRLPRSGENLTILRDRRRPVLVDVPGGKGCNQAVACARLLLPTSSSSVTFLGQFGDDAVMPKLRDALLGANVRLSSLCSTSGDHPSGRGYVLIVPDTGEVCAVVDGGSNARGWERWYTTDDRDDDDDDEEEEGKKKSGGGGAEEDDDDDDAPPPLSDDDVLDAVSCHSLLMMQCEIPQFVNLRLARAARRSSSSSSSGGSSSRTIVMLDPGGEDRIIDREILECVDVLTPNETELARLADSFGDDVNDDDVNEGGGEDDDLDDILASSSRGATDLKAGIVGPDLRLSGILSSVRKLQRNGASDVLVTLGSRGSIFVRGPPDTPPPSSSSSSAAAAAGPFSPSSSVVPRRRRPFVYRPPCALPPGSTVVDETGAGDCYRAAFAVAVLEERRRGRSGGGGGGGRHVDASPLDDDDVLARCMDFASAAGALAVTKEGAVPSIPTRDEVDGLLRLLSAGDRREDASVATSSSSSAAAAGVVPRGGGRDDDDVDDDAFPFLFGSRINSMKDRPELLPSSSSLVSPREYLARQASVRGLGCVDFNYPQHFDGHWTPEEARAALDDVNLVAGAVCLRYPSKFARGAMNHPDEGMRREAIEITKGAARVARVLGCNEVVVWSAYDGYDYPFQTNYREKWDQIVDAFRECCDAYPDIKWSLEFKPTDENTRFFTVPSTGAALLLVKEIDRPNMGLTLDMGHMLMAGENPGQSIAMVGGEKLYGIQLNDGYTRLAAEDGLMFGSIHPSVALEALYQLRRINFRGHLYFDTFPQRTDPVAEAEYNIRRVKEFWSAVLKMDSDEIERIARENDAIGALELVNEALRR